MATLPPKDNHMPAAQRTRLAFFAVLALAGCAPGADLPQVPPAYTGPYLLGPGDDVRIITFGDTTLSGNFAVDETGFISMPLLGQVKASGLTTDALQGVVIGNCATANCSTHRVW